MSKLAQNRFFTFNGLRTNGGGCSTGKMFAVPLLTLREAQRLDLRDMCILFYYLNLGKNIFQIYKKQFIKQLTELTLGLDLSKTFHSRNSP